MSDSRRPPGSREEDAWLSDEQLGQCAPAETEPFQSPVPTRMISNGEYMPHPQTKQQQHVEFRLWKQQLGLEFRLELRLREIGLGEQWLSGSAQGAPRPLAID